MNKNEKIAKRMPKKVETPKIKIQIGEPNLEPYLFLIFICLIVIFLLMGISKPL